MAFSFTTDIFNYMDTVTKEFVASNLGIVISTISPVIGLALICKLTLDGLFTLARPHGEPLSSLIKKFIVWSMIISFASAGGLYQTQLADAAMKIPDEFPRYWLLTVRPVALKMQWATTSTRPSMTGCRLRVLRLITPIFIAVPGWRHYSWLARSLFPRC